MQNDADRAAREALEDMQRGEPLSTVIPKILNVAKLRGDIREYAWLRLQLIDLDEDKPWNPPPDLDTVWQQIEAECDHSIPRNVRWAVYSDYMKSRQIDRESGPSCISVSTMEVGKQNAQTLESQGRLLSMVPLLRHTDGIYDRLADRIRSYLERSLR